MGWFSCAAGVSVQVWNVALQLRALASETLSGARLPLSDGAQPLEGVPPRAPDPAAGGLACVPKPACTKARNLATVTSNVSSANALRLAPYVALVKVTPS